MAYNETPYLRTIMNENEIEPEEKRSVLSTVKTTAEVVVLAYTAAMAIKGLYGLTMEWKNASKKDDRLEKETEKEA